MQLLLSLRIILVYFVVSIEMIENPKFHALELMMRDKIFLETLKPSSAFDVRPEWLVGCSLVVSVQTRSDPKNSNGGPSTCPIFLWQYSVTEQTPPHLVDCSTTLITTRKEKNVNLACERRCLFNNFTFESFTNWWGSNRDGQPRPQELWSIATPVLEG